MVISPYSFQAVILGIRSPYQVVATRGSTLMSLCKDDVLQLIEEVPQESFVQAMKKVAIDRMEAFQQVVQDKVLVGDVTTKNGNALRKVLSTNS